MQLPAALEELRGRATDNCSRPSIRGVTVSYCEFGAADHAARRHPLLAATRIFAL